MPLGARTPPVYLPSEEMVDEMSMAEKVLRRFCVGSSSGRRHQRQRWLRRRRQRERDRAPGARISRAARADATPAFAVPATVARTRRRCAVLAAPTAPTHAEEAHLAGAVAKAVLAGCVAWTHRLYDVGDGRRQRIYWKKEEEHATADELSESASGGGSGWPRPT